VNRLYRFPPPLRYSVPATMLAIAAALLWISNSVEPSTAVLTVLVVVVGFLAWLIFHQMLLSRVNHLVMTARRVGQGDFAANFELSGRDELATLATALASMTSQLRAHAEEIRSSRSALEASHDRFAAVARATNDIIWDWDPRTDRVWRNAAVKTLLGYGDDHNADSLDWLRHVAPADHQRVEASFRDALASGASTWSSEYQLNRADGSIAQIFDRAIIVRDDGGRPIRMVGAMTDITAQRRAEEGHRRLAAILEASPDFVGTADAVTLRVSWINRAGRRMVGLTDDEDVSQMFVQDFQPRWVLDSLLDEIVSVAVGGGVWTGEAGLLHRNGREIPVLKTVVAHTRSDGKAEYISTVARDIRDHKQLEAELLQAQKMESIGRLAGGVAHDFNNMLTAIIGYTELAKAQLPPDHPVQGDLTNVHDAARRSAALTRQLLAFARKQVISPRAVDLNELITRMETMLNRLLGEDIRLSADLKPDVAPVLIDPGQFEQVLMNLAVNARDAMPEGGTLRVETKNVSLDDAWCHQHPGSTPGEYGLVRVSDTGMGMSREVMDHLFEPFFTTKGSGEGTGLGLATCYGIVKQSGGSIWVSSEQGRGTTFDIYVPRYNGQPLPSREHAHALQNAGRETILLVEDETFVRDLAQRALSARGYRILTAGDGREAVEIARTHQGSIDLVVSDVVMPHMGVAELAAKLREHRPGVRLLFMSGYSETAVHRHGVVEAGAGLIQKPFTPESLARQVREALH
jgi:PAS domain S-box-containing protein